MDLQQAIKAGLIREELRDGDLRDGECEPTPKGVKEVFRIFFQGFLKDAQDSLDGSIRNLHNVGISEATPLGAETVLSLKFGATKLLVNRVLFALDAYQNWNAVAVRDEFFEHLWPSMGFPPEPIACDFQAFTDVYGTPSYLGLALMALEEVEGDAYFKAQLKEHILLKIQDCCECCIDLGFKVTEMDS